MELDLWLLGIFVVVGSAISFRITGDWVCGFVVGAMCWTIFGLIMAGDSDPCK